MTADDNRDGAASLAMLLVEPYVSARQLFPLDGTRSVGSLRMNPAAPEIRPFKQRRTMAHGRAQVVQQPQWQDANHCAAPCLIPMLQAEGSQQRGLFPPQIFVTHFAKCIQ
jgi:hypothetical protein